MVGGTSRLSIAALGVIVALLLIDHFMLVAFLVLQFLIVAGSLLWLVQRLERLTSDLDDQTVRLTEAQQEVVALRQELLARSRWDRVAAGAGAGFPPPPGHPPPGEPQPAQPASGPYSAWPTAAWEDVTWPGTSAVS